MSIAEIIEEAAATVEAIPAEVVAKVETVTKEAHDALSARFEVLSTHYLDFLTRYNKFVEAVSATFTAHTAAIGEVQATVAPKAEPSPSAAAVAPTIRVDTAGVATVGAAT